MSNERYELCQGYMLHVIAELENIIHNFLDDKVILRKLRNNEFPIFKTRLNLNNTIEQLRRLAQSLD